MKIGFYSPYFDSMSGGERYILTLASHWSLRHDVFLFWDDPKMLGQSEKRLHIDLSRIQTTENVFKTKNVFKKLAISRGYDCIFFLTDGSIPTTFAKRNILHFQVPFREISVHPIKLTRFQEIVCNSQFTRQHIDPRVRKRAKVIYPPVESIAHQNVAKKKIILSVGRFHPTKKQDVLIDIFRQGITSRKFSGFELILAGGFLPADVRYLEALKKLAGGLPVRFYPNLAFHELTSWYNRALMYWHAAGYGETRPENMEHFGITTVEAMSVGCIPVVYRGGGQPEIIREDVNGYLWDSTAECLDITERMIKNQKLRQVIARNAKKVSKRFGVSQFTQAFDTLLSHLI